MFTLALASILVAAAAMATAALPQQEDINAADAAAEAAQRAADEAEAAADMAIIDGEGVMDGSVTPPALAQPAWLSQGVWLLAGVGDGGANWYFEDFAPVANPGALKVKIRVDETPDRARTHNNTLRLADIDCVRHRYRITRTTLYDDAGRATEADERGDGSMVPAEPESIIRLVADAACAHAAPAAEIDGR